MDRTVLERKSLAELRQIAAALELSGYQRMKKADLAELIVGAAERANGGGQPSGADAPAGDGEAETARPRARARQRAEANGPAADAPSGGGDTRDDDAAGSARAERRDGGGDGAQGRGDDREDAEGGPARDDGDRGRRRRKGGRNQPHHEDLDDAEVREGVLDLLPEGYGFLRVTGYLSGERDVYVSQSFVRRHALRRGDRVAGPIRRNKSNDKFPALARVDAVEGVPFADIDPDTPRPVFDELTPLAPTDRLRVGDAPDASLGVRLLDRFAPIGRGQRVLLTGPHRAGKTTLLAELAAAVRATDADLELLVVLIDERPEEVTEVARTAGVDVVASHVDRPAEDHTAVAELAIERAKRLAERGRDVVVLLDSATRLGRAYHVAQPGGGRSTTGPIDASAVYPVERFLAAARAIEEGGSLTVVATAATHTSAPADETVVDELSGVANAEVRLDADRSRARRFPAIDLAGSATRREERLLDDDELAATVAVRRALAEGRDRLDAVVDRAAATDDGAALLAALTATDD